MGHNSYVLESSTVCDYYLYIYLYMFPDVTDLFIITFCLQFYVET